jgi:hypothetical protein
MISCFGQDVTSEREDFSSVYMQIAYKSYKASLPSAMFVLPSLTIPDNVQSPERFAVLFLLPTYSYFLSLVS